jgi:hypothetical protein
MTARWLLGPCAIASLLACGSPPEPRPVANAVASDNARPELGHRDPNAPDDCAPQPNRPPPQPLERSYEGLAHKARCQREVYSIMGGVTHFLGVRCNYCHLVPDYRAMTHRKEIANWMAAELVPALQRKSGGELWCADCHASSGQAVPKILGDPRSQAWAVEWMTTHLVEDFTTKHGAPLRCKSCHQGNLGSPEFRRNIILTPNLPKD